MQSPWSAQPTPVAPPVPTSGMASASLVLGIGGLTVLPLLGSILAIILGYMARNDIRRRPHEVSGEGIILGWVAVGLAGLSFVVVGALGLCGLGGAFGSANFR